MNNRSFPIVVVIALLALVLLVAAVAAPFGYMAYRRTVVARHMENLARQVELAEQNFEKAQRQDTFRFLSWNVESGGNDPDVIAQRLAQLGSYDVAGISWPSMRHTQTNTDPCCP